MIVSCISQDCVNGGRPERRDRYMWGPVRDRSETLKEERTLDPVDSGQEYDCDCLEGRLCSWTVAAVVV